MKNNSNRETKKGDPLPDSVFYPLLLCIGLVLVGTIIVIGIKAIELQKYLDVYRKLIPLKIFF